MDAMDMDGDEERREGNGVTDRPTAKIQQRGRGKNHPSNGWNFLRDIKIVAGKSGTNS